MHNNNYSNKNSIGGFFAFIFMFFGIIILVGFVTGLFRYIFWPVPMVGTIIGIILIAYIISTFRSRAHYKRIQRQERFKYGVYQPTENPFWKNQETQVVQEQEPAVRIVSTVKFCDYCGMKLEEEMSYCTNCGNKIN